MDRPTPTNSVAPDQILESAFASAARLTQPAVTATEFVSLIETVVRNPQNRAGTRFLLACALAKVDQPGVDIRKPYTEIGGSDTYSGRAYDEQYVFPFVTRHDLPCNATTAFLTPAFRNIGVSLTADFTFVGRPRHLYQAVLLLINAVHLETLDAGDLLVETIRWLIIVQGEQTQRLKTLLADLNATKGETSLSSEQIVSLIAQHMQLQRTSRLPVLIVAAAYVVAGPSLGEQIKPLQSHSAADLQTNALGDLEITLIDDTQTVTTYEMKTRTVTTADINRAIAKVAAPASRIDNYIFITTQPIDPVALEYATAQYAETGIEFTITDCIAFIRHFLHLFHRARVHYLEQYQQMILDEPASAIEPALREAFLSMRKAAETQAGPN